MSPPKLITKDIEIMIHPQTNMMIGTTGVINQYSSSSGGNIPTPP